MDADGSNVKQLTKGAAVSRVPCWSPDGKQIAFCRRSPATSSEICIMDADGGNVKVVGSGGDAFDPTWSPDGKKILFTSFRAAGGGFRLYVMDTDGGNVKQLTNIRNTLGYVYPSWSPDGKKVTWAEWLNPGLEIYVADPDGKNAKQLTKLGGNNAYPGWSSDGKKIVFHHWGNDGSGAYYVMDADGDNQKELFKKEPPIEGGRPVWRPK